MAECETLKLPKPIAQSELRPEFLTFPEGRRWDLLEFVRPEDIAELKACNLGPDGRRFYLVSWKNSWRAESSLVYCEKLLQDFWSKHSSFLQDPFLRSSGNAKLSSLQETQDVSTVATTTTTFTSFEGRAGRLETSRSSVDCMLARNGNQGFQGLDFPKMIQLPFLSAEGSGNVLITRGTDTNQTSNVAITDESAILPTQPLNVTLEKPMVPSVPSLAYGSHVQTMQAELVSKAISGAHSYFCKEIAHVENASPHQDLNVLLFPEPAASSSPKESCNDLLKDQARFDKFDYVAQDQEQELPSSSMGCVSLTKVHSSVPNCVVEIPDTLPLGADTTISDASLAKTVAAHDAESHCSEDVFRSCNDSSVDDTLSNVVDAKKVKGSSKCGLFKKAIDKRKVQKRSLNPAKSGIVHKRLSSTLKSAAGISSPAPRKQMHIRTLSGRTVRADKVQASRGETIMKTVIEPDAASAKMDEDHEEADEPYDGVALSEDDDLPKANFRGVKLRCMVCDRSLSSEQNLMKHLLTHNNNHTCQICMKTFKSTHFLKHHMDKHNKQYEYSCPVCSKKFKFRNNMRGHLRKHSMEKKFQCDVCDKKFIGRYNLKEHMKAHSDNRPFACDFCKKAYKDRGALNKHLLTHQEKKVECDICKRPFSNVAQVKRHMQFHLSWPGDTFKRKTNVGPDGERLHYPCEYCGKMFNHYSNMNAHVHKKHKERKVRCNQCAKAFAYQYELREHMFIHNGGEGSKFKCQVCDKTFQRSTTLKNHERTTHLGIKRFKCDLCGKMFGTKFNMKVHMDKLHSSQGAAVTREPKPRRSRAVKVENALTDERPAVSIGGAQMENVVAPFLSNLSVQHALGRAVSTSDIIRNAMAHIPDLGYFPLQPRTYQFYSIPPVDFST